MARSRARRHCIIDGRRRQRGLALLMALMIVVLATTIAIDIIYAEKYTIRKTAHIYQMDTANLYALGLEDWARLFLRKDREDSEIDSLDEDWATGVPGLPIEGGYLSGYLEDEQGRFNLNSLASSELAVTRFRRLCNNLEIEDRFVAALIDWIDPDFDITYPDGMEENYESYRVANRDMVDISELRLVHHVTPEIYAALEPYITALPGVTSLNVNTMSEAIYQSLLEEGGDAAGFVEEREQEAFASIEDFVERLQIPVETEGLAVDTAYFRAHGQIVQGEQSYRLTSLLYRDDKGSTRVLNRRLGQF